MSLPSGTYRAVLLWAKRHGNRKFYTLEFALESGERERASVFFKDMGAVFCAANFIIREGCIWSPLNPDVEQPLVDLQLKFSVKYQSTNAIRASKTGVTMPCDIRAPVVQSYSEF